MSNENLAIIGSFISILLTVNGFFIHSLVARLTKIEIELAGINANSISNGRLLEHHDEQIDQIKDALHRSKH